MATKSWNDITSLSSLSLMFDTGLTDGKIYANGNHQIGVVVSVTALDSDRKEIDLTPADVINHAWLVDYADGSDLSRDMQTQWNYTVTENRYHVGAASAANASQCVFFLMCAADYQENPKSISVRFALPSGEIISTAKVGTQGFEDHIVGRADPARRYTEDDISVSREDTYNGGNCDHDNYYCKITDEKFHWVFVESIDDPEFASMPYDVDDIPRLQAYDARTYWGVEANFQENSGYIAQLGLPGKMSMISMQQSQRDFSVNQRSGQFTMARLTTTGSSVGSLKDDPDSSWDLNYFNRNVTLYDQYGNTGKFYVAASDDGNTLSLIEGQTD